MTGIRKIQHTRLCPGCGAWAQVGRNCPACGLLVEASIELPVVMVACSRCGKRVRAGVGCPWCGEVNE